MALENRMIKLQSGPHAKNPYYLNCKQPKCFCIYSAIRVQILYLLTTGDIIKYLATLHYNNNIAAIAKSVESVQSPTKNHGLLYGTTWHFLRQDLKLKAYKYSLYKN